MSATWKSRAPIRSGVILVLVVTAGLVVVVALGSLPAGAAPVPDCGDDTHDAVLYVADSGLEVLDDTGEPPPETGPFLDESTIQTGDVTLSADGPVSVRVEEAADSTVCLRAVDASVVPLRITRNGANSVFVEGRAEALSLSRLEFDPETDAADIAYTADDTLTVRIERTGLAPGTTIDAVAAGTDRRITRGEVMANGTLGLSLPAGRRTVNLRVPPSPPLDAPPPQIGVSSRVLNFGEVPVGTTETLTITVENLATTQQSLTVNTTHITGTHPGAFTIVSGGAPFTLGPGETRRIEIAFSPDSAGKKAAQLQIASTESGSQIDVWLTNRRTHVIVQEVDEAQEGTSRDTRTVNIEAVNVQANAGLLINITRPSLANRSAAIELVEMTVTRAGNFSMNITHADEPVRADHATYNASGTAPLQYFHIEHSTPEATFDATAFVIRVSKARLSPDSAPEDIEMLRYEAGTWDPQSVTVLKETETAFVLRVETDGFSQFVVAAPESVVTAPPGDDAVATDSNATGILPFRMPRIPGDPSPTEAAVAGTTVSLGWVLRPFLKDMIATFLIFSERSFRVGDEIEWAEQQESMLSFPRSNRWQEGSAGNQGVVKDIGYRTTRVQTYDGSMLNVPNAVLTDAMLVNAGGADPLRLQIMVPIDLNTELPRAKEAIQQAATDHEAVLDYPAPAAQFLAFEGERMLLRLLVWIAQEDMRNRVQIKDEISDSVDSGLPAAHVPFEYPTRAIHDSAEVLTSWHSRN